MTLRDYLQIVARSWIVVAVTAAVGVATAAIVALTSTPTYTSEAQVLFTGHATTNGQDLAYVGNYVQTRMQTYKRLGTSTSMMTTVGRAMGSDETPKEIADRTEIEVSQLNTVATIYATDTSAKGSAQTADTVAAVLLDTVQKLEAENAADPKANGGAESSTATVQGVVTGRAEVPESPSDPRLALYLLVGLFGGLIVAIGVVSLREVLSSEASASSPGEDP